MVTFSKNPDKDLFAQTTPSFSYENYAKVLNIYVDDKGGVNYKGLKENSSDPNDSSFTSL